MVDTQRKPMGLIKKLRKAKQEAKPSMCFPGQI